MSRIANIKENANRGMIQHPNFLGAENRLNQLPLDCLYGLHLFEVLLSSFFHQSHVQVSKLYELQSSSNNYAHICIVEELPPFIDIVETLIFSPAFCRSYPKFKAPSPLEHNMQDPPQRRHPINRIRRRLRYIPRAQEMEILVDKPAIEFALQQLMCLMPKLEILQIISWHRPFSDSGSHSRSGLELDFKIHVLSKGVTSNRVYPSLSNTICISRISISRPVTYTVYYVTSTSQSHWTSICTR